MEIPLSIAESVIQPIDIDPYWIVGFTEGDGCFFLTVSEKKNTQVKMGYQVSQHVRDTLLIKSFQ